MDTTSVGENIIFRLSTNWRKDTKEEAKDPNANAMKEKLKDKTVKCRICNGEHFTARCPYKDTMAPVGAEGAADVAAGMGDEPSANAAGAPGAGKKGSYVPPALRGDRGAAGGERMGGGKYGSERDDLATLRVTNVSSTTSINYIPLPTPLSVYLTPCLHLIPFHSSLSSPSLLIPTHTSNIYDICSNIIYHRSRKWQKRTSSATCSSGSAG